MEGKSVTRRKHFWYWQRNRVDYIEKSGGRVCVLISKITFALAPEQNCVCPKE